MDKPTRVDIRYGYMCNNNCVFCVVRDARNKFKDMDTSKIKSLIEEAANKGATELTFTGGEPTIRKDVFDIVSYAKSFGFKKIMFTTNGRMLAYDGFAERIIDAGVNKFMVSLHGHTDEIYTKITNVEGGFDQVIKGIDNIIRLRQEICLSFVVNNYNYHALPEYADFISNRFKDVNLFQMTYVMPCGGDHELNRKNIPRLTDAAPYIRKVLKNKEKLNVKDISVMDVPLCFMKGYERFINEFNIQDMEVHAPNPEHSSTDYNKKRKTNKMKGKQCKDCRFFRECEGVWPEYAELYGLEELIPIR